MKKEAKLKLLKEMEEIENYILDNKITHFIKYPGGGYFITIDGEEKEISEDELEKYKRYNRLIMWLPASEMTSEEREKILARQK